MLLQRWEIDSGRLNKSWRVANDKSYMVAGTNPHLPSSEQTEEAPTAFPLWIQNKISITNTRVGRCLVCCRLHLVKQIGDKNSSAWNWNLASVYSRGCWHLVGWPSHWLSFIQEQNILGIWIVSINPSRILKSFSASLNILSVGMEQQAKKRHRILWRRKQDQ